ncbi:hypothetical protein GCM10025789_31050 [Tessaracoccus lubricantis]|uniref:HTH cro/C1-type domain-containing protein n=1 Tax=Tessaracoccus lubricantis TaxID=545543 RepID=A0ABP9FQZ5_9ACTN
MAVTSAGLPRIALSEVTGVNHAAIGKVLAGASWPDTRTLARLERGLEASLWPVVRAAGTHVAATPDVVVGEGTEQVGDGDGSAAGRGTT